MSLFFFSSRRRHTRLQGDWSSDVCSSDLISTFSIGANGVLALLGSVPVPVNMGQLPDGGAPAPANPSTQTLEVRSEERRVGKECGARWSAEHETQKDETEERGSRTMQHRG